MLTISPRLVAHQLLARPRQWYARRVRDAGPDALAGTIVWWIWFLCTALAARIVATRGGKLPRADDWCNLGCLYKGFWEVLPDLWIQHCEHRIPLPRLIAWLVLPVVNYDWRSLMVVNVLLLSLASLALIRAVRAARGRSEWSDAFLPITLMGLAHYDNLLWGFQVQFTSSTCLASLALAIILRVQGTPTTRQGLGVGVCALMLPLCGANGLAYAAPLAGWLAVAARSARHNGTRQSLGFAALAAGVVALIGTYFIGYSRPDFHPPAGDPMRDVRAFTQFLAMGLGPVALDGSLRTRTDWPFLWPVAAGVVLIGMIALAVGRHRAGGLRWVGLAGYLAGGLVLAAGVAHGRAGLSPDAGFAPRYVTLSAPLLVWAYLTVGLGFPAPLARGAQVLLCLLSCVLLWPNTLTALTQSDTMRWKLRDAEAEVRGGVPLPFLPDRLAPLLFVWEGDYFGESIRNMHARKMGLFAAARPAPDMREIEVPVVATRVGGGQREGAGYRFDAGECYLSLALDRSRHLIGVRLEYDYINPAGTYSASSLMAGTKDFTQGIRVGERPVADPLRVGTGKSSLVWIDAPASHLRIQFHAPGCYFEPRRLMLLVQP